jgi:hypothetical protein
LHKDKKYENSFSQKGTIICGWQEKTEKHGL